MGEKKDWREELQDIINREMFKEDLMIQIKSLVEQELDRAREEGREELLNSIVVGIEQLRSIVMMFNPMSAEIRAKQSGEVEAYNGLLEKLSKLKTKEK